MSVVEVTAGTTEPLQVYARAALGGPLTGSINLRVQVRRASDGLYLDFGDGTFKAYAAAAIPRAPLTEVDATNDPGWYRYGSGVSTAGWATGAHYATFLEQTTTLVADGPQFAFKEVRVVSATASTLSTRIPTALVSGRIDASVGSIPTAVLDALVDAVWNEVLTGGTHNVPSSAGRRLRELTAARLVLAGTSAGGTVNTIVLTGGSTDDHVYQGNAIVITGGTGAGQTRTILHYIGATTTAVVGPAWAITPDNTSEFTVVGFATPAVVDTGLADGAGASTIVLNEDSETVDDRYVGMTLVVLSGTGAGQSRLVADYDGATLTATVTPAWDTVPDATSAYVLLGSALATALTAIQDVQATLALLPGDAADAVWAKALSSTSPGTAGRLLRRLYQLAFNRSELTNVGGGLLTLYDDDGTTPLLTVDVRDVGGDAVAIPATSPAKRTAAAEVP